MTPIGKGGGKIAKKGKEVEYDGKKYVSIHELCRELNISYSAVSHKFYRAKNIEEAVAWARKTEERDRKLVVWGTQYKSLSEIAKSFGINLGSIRARLKEDVPVEAVIGKLLVQETIQFREKEYRGISTLAAAYGKDAALVLGRLAYGYDLERALFEPVKKIDREDWKIEYQGKKYDSRRHLFREMGINGSCVYEMMKNHDIDFDSAMDIFCECKKRMGIPKEKMISYIPVCIIGGREYRSVVEVANAFQISGTALATYKSRHGLTGMLETLQAMQEETHLCYILNGEKKTYKEILKMGYTNATCKQIPKKDLPRYPQLQGIDFITDCIDTMKIYEEVKEEIIRQAEGMQINM